MHLILPPASLPPAGEAGRLLAIQQYAVRQALQEPVFSGFVNVSAHLLQVPIALIGLVGPHDVHYAAARGLPSRSWQPRPEAICSLVVERDQAVVLTNLSQAGPADLPPAARSAARNRGYCFYAGVPLHAPVRVAIGTLCVVDHRERVFAAHERQLLEQLAHLIERLLVVRQTYQTGRRAIPESWQLVQDYVSDKLGALGGLTSRADYSLPGHPPMPLAVAELITRRLNELSQVLAEPLPDAE